MKRKAKRRLTPRELEVLDRLAHGYKNKEIADELVITTATVETHVKSILWKMDARSRTHAAAMAVQMGITSPFAEKLPRKQSVIITRENGANKFFCVEDNPPDPKDEKKKVKSLTERQQETLALFVNGNISNRKIAEVLDISYHTTRSHIRKIARELGDEEMSLTRDEFQRYALFAMEES